MSWFLDQFVNAVLQLVIAFVTFMTNQLVQPLGFSPSVITSYFPAITLCTEAFKIIGIFLTIVIVLFQLTRIIFGDASYGEKDNSITLVLRAALAIVLILWSMSAMNYIFNVFAEPFYVLSDERGQNVFDITNDENSIFRDSVEEGFDRFVTSAQNIDEEDYNDAITGIKDWLFPGVSILKALIELVCILLIGYKFITFLLEILERYLLLMLQAFTSPLIWPTISSVSTIGIFKKWVEMFISNFLLIYFNMWLLGLVVNGMGTIFNPEVELIPGTNWQPNFVLGSCIVYAMLRIAQGLDTQLSKLLVTSTTGRNFAQELLMSFRVLQNMFRPAKKAIVNHGPDGDAFYQLGDNKPDITPPGPQEVFRDHDLSSESVAQKTRDESEPQSFRGEVLPGKPVEKTAPLDETVPSVSEVVSEPTAEEVSEPTAQEEMLEAWGIPSLMSSNEFCYLSSIPKEELKDALGENALSPDWVYREDNGLLRIQGTNADGESETIAHLLPVTDESSLSEIEPYELLEGDTGQKYLVLPESSEINGEKLLTSAEQIPEIGRLEGEKPFMSAEQFPESEQLENEKLLSSAEEIPELKQLENDDFYLDLSEGERLPLYSQYESLEEGSNSLELEREEIPALPEQSEAGVEVESLPQFMEVK